MSGRRNNTRVYFRWPTLYSNSKFARDPHSFPMTELSHGRGLSLKNCDVFNSVCETPAYVDCTGCIHVTPVLAIMQ